MRERSGELVRRASDREIVGAEQDRILRYQPLGGLHTDAGTRFGEARVVLAPQFAPSGVDDDCIARLQEQVLLLQRALAIHDRDLLGVAEHCRRPWIPPRRSARLE